MQRFPPHFGPDRFPGQLVSLQNEHCAFLTIEPRDVLPGSGLIVPFAARATVFDLTADEWLATLALLVRAKEVIDARYRPDGYTVGWNVGREGGQDIPQAHLHVIPRFSDEPMAGQGLRYHLKQPENRRAGRD
jgi:diadenosine tetraphosphate (Ap4A) HIT family hydrolase